MIAYGAVLCFIGIDLCRVLSGILFQGYAPDNTQETVLAVISIFCQVLIFSFLLGILLHYVSSVMRFCS